MSFNNSLRLGLAFAQDAKQPTLAKQAAWGQQDQQHRQRDRQRGAYRSKADRRALALASLTSDLYRDGKTSARVTDPAGWWWVGVARPEETFSFTRSSEAGIREREAQVQVQCSRTFHHDAPGSVPYRAATAEDYNID